MGGGVRLLCLTGDNSSGASSSSFSSSDEREMICLRLVDEMTGFLTLKSNCIFIPGLTLAWVVWEASLLFVLFRPNLGKLAVSIRQDILDSESEPELLSSPYC